MLHDNDVPLREDEDAAANRVETTPDGETVVICKTCDERVVATADGHCPSCDTWIGHPDAEMTMDPEAFE